MLAIVWTATGTCQHNLSSKCTGPDDNYAVNLGLSHVDDRLTTLRPECRAHLCVGGLNQAGSATDGAEPYSSLLGSLRFKVLDFFLATMMEALTESS